MKHFLERQTMAWLLVIVAGLFEVGWAIGLKYTDGFTRLLPTLATVLSMVVSLGLLGLALKTLPVGTAYAVWTGIGTVGTAALGILLLGEPAGAMRLACTALIVAGKAKDLKQGAALAAKSIESGEAEGRLDRLIAVSNAVEDRT